LVTSHGVDMFVPSAPVTVIVNRVVVVIGFDGNETLVVPRMGTVRSVRPRRSVTTAVAGPGEWFVMASVAIGP
jgi:hypothetical protein